MQSLLAEISLPSIRHNAEYFLKRAPMLIAVVKDDAYGHGAEEVALALRGIASSFAVATVEEGASLRLAGIEEEILVLTPPMTEEEAVRLLYYDLTASLTSYPALELLAEAAEKVGICPKAHLAINTGMNRYGFAAEEAKRAALTAKGHGIAVEGVFSHYFMAENDAARDKQNVLFLRAVSKTREVFPACLAHIAATGGSLKGENFDAVRVGLGLYGYLPNGGHLRRAMKVYAYVSNSCQRTGEGLGYAFAERNIPSVHTLRLGYGDGFFRTGHDGATENLCMDAALMEGEATFGEKKLVVSDFEAYAKRHSTSVYEALVRLSSKAVKRYIRD